MIHNFFSICLFALLAVPFVSDAYETGKLVKTYHCEAKRLDALFKLIGSDKDIKLNIYEHLVEGVVIRYYGETKLPITDTQVVVGIPLSENLKKERFELGLSTFDSIYLATDGFYVNEIVGVDTLPDRILLRGQTRFENEGHISVNCQ